MNISGIFDSYRTMDHLLHFTEEGGADDARLVLELGRQHRSLKGEQWNKSFVLFADAATNDEQVWPE